MNLAEKYRPTNWVSIVGNKRAIQTVNLLRTRSDTLAGRAFWIGGPSGTGKTTIARIIAAECADPICTFEVDGKELTTATIEEWERKSRLYGWNGKGWAFIVNEAHGLSRTLITRFLTVLERIRTHCVWIFTTTTSGQLRLFEDQIDAGPLLSRCVELQTEVSDLDVALHVQRIATAEGLNGQPVTAYVEMGKRYHWNIRAMLHAVESGAMLQK
jgi:replication-associated recombination protein RarA